MALTPEDVKTLTAPFREADHYWRKGGAAELVYIEEEAISGRIESVDPSWELQVISLFSPREKEVVAHVRLTIKGVTRDGIGMQPLGGAEAEKSAATDAFKRAARLFGIGRYLLNPPDKAHFRGWLATLQKQHGVTAPTPAPANPFEGLPEVQPPAPNGWTQEQAASLVTEARQKHVTTDELLGVLGVKRISEYEPGFGAARRALADYLKARPAQPAQEEQVVF